MELNEKIWSVNRSDGRDFFVFLGQNFQAQAFPYVQDSGLNQAFE